MTGVYIHIPFCKSRCRYCDFFSTTMLDRREAYVEAVIREASLLSQSDILSPKGERNIRTIYFGGGTPSLLEPEQIERILNSLAPFGERVPQSGGKGAEITMEANPGDLTIEKLRGLREVGINRLSIGIQSFNDTLLQRIGRRHQAAEAIEAVRMAREAGFDNLSIDLMYGLPGQTMADWQANVAQALALRPEHISAYCLIYEEGTPLYRMREEGVVAETDEETANEMVAYLNEQLRSAGYMHYEVSNYCLPGRESQHNSSYWEDIPYIGLGAGAHSYDGRKRWWNVSDIERYIEGTRNQEPGTRNQEPGIRTEEELTDEDKRIERIMLGLRTRKGIEKDLLIDKDEILAQYLKLGYIQLKDQQVIATERGIQLLNRIIEDLI